MSTASPTTDLQARLERLDRQVERERAARQEAEAIAERSLRHLYLQKERVSLLQALSAAANAAGSAEDAMSEALRILCDHTGWPVGHVYRCRGERLVPTALWCGHDAERFARWRAVSEAVSFDAGEGLPGRVLAAGRPVWIRDVTQDPGFPRAAAAAEHGLQGALAFPVVVGEEVVAVLEFFSERAEEPDEALLALAAQAGTQLGYVVERQRLKRRHEQILASAGEGIYGLDTEGCITFINAAGAALVGWEPEALVGEPQHAVLHHHRADGTPYPAEDCPIYRTLRDGEERRVAGEVFWRRDGTSFPVAYVATPLREGREIVGAVVVFHDVSEREELRALRETQARLAHEEMRYRLAARATNDAIWDRDLATGTIGWTLAIATIFGWTDAADGTTLGWWEENIHPDDRARVVEGICALIAGTGESWQAAYCFRRADGTYADADDRGYVVRDADGTATRMVGAMQDVTERRVSEAALRRGEAELLALVDNLPELAWSARADGHIDFYNRRWYDYTGTTFEAMEGWGWDKVHAPEWLAEVTARWRHSIETGEPFEMAFPLRGADGAFRWFLTRVHPLRDDEGRVTRWIGTNTDIHDQRETEEALRQSEERYRFLGQTLLQQIWTAEPDGRLDYVNRFVLDYFGRTNDEMIGEGWQDIVHPDDLPTVVARWTHALETGEPYEVEFRLRRAADGMYRWHLGRAHALVDDDGAVVKWFGTNTDLHERKQTEEVLAAAQRELAEANRRLEARVAERTAELRASEALLHNVTANALDGIAALEAVRDDAGAIVDFRWLLVNPQAVAMYGRPAEALVGALQNEVLPEVRALGLHDALVHVVETGEPFRQEIEDAAAPGRWFSLSVSKLDSGIVALFRDISEAKQAEAAIRASEALLQEAQHLAHVGSWRWKVGEDAVAWSDELFRIFGYEPGAVEVDFARYNERLHPEDREAVGQAVQNAVATGAGYELNHRIVRPDGTVRWIHSFGEPTRDAGGAVVALQGTAQDVTARVEAEAALTRYAQDLERAEAELRAGSDFLQSTLDSLTAHVAILDENGVVIAVNEAWRRFAQENDYADGTCGLGQSYVAVSEATRGVGAGGAGGAGSASEVAEGIRRLLAGEIEQFTTEYPCHSPTEQRWFLLRITRFEGPEGLRLVTAHENVTTMKLAQAALRRYAGELEESNEELAKFAYVASHDLQEPLRMVTSFLQLLERRYDGQLDETATQYIGYAVDGARRMQRLIQDLLAYSRVGTRARDFAPVDSHEVVLDVLHDLGPAVADAGGEVTHEALPVVSADATQVHQLFLNLIGNALKFRRPDVPSRIRIAAAPEVLEGGRPGWRFTVSDNGIGLDPQYAERIFQVFQRLHTRDEYEGTGIGLAICRKIVERHGGMISVTSTLGEGATFTFTLPSPPSEAVSSPAPSP